MRVRLVNFKSGFALAVAAMSGLLLCGAHAESKQPKGRAIEFSDTQSADVATNLNQLTSSKKDGLKLFEEELNRSMHPFSPGNSMDTRLAPVYRPPVLAVIPTARAKEEMDRRKNWAFASPEELMLGGSGQDSLSPLDGGANGKKKNSGSTLGQFYDNLGRPQAERGPSGSSMEEMARARINPRDSQDEEHLPGAIKASEQQLKKMLAGENGFDTFRAAPVRSSFEDFFGLGDNTPSPSQVQAHKAYMDQYRQLLDGASLTPVSGTDSSRQPVASGLDTLSRPSQRQ
jgi:hypothetical protein